MSVHKKAELMFATKNRDWLSPLSIFFGAVLQQPRFVLGQTEMAVKIFSQYVELPLDNKNNTSKISTDCIYSQ